jgi:hypothetical protein
MATLELPSGAASFRYRLRTACWTLPSRPVRRSDAALTGAPSLYGHRTLAEAADSFASTELFEGALSTTTILHGGHAQFQCFLERNRRLRAITWRERRRADWNAENRFPVRRA